MELPWLALGGGGYDVGAVARCWSLAYGQMIGLTLPTSIPTDLVQLTGTDQLRDSVVPTVPSDIQQECRKTAELNVESIKANIFPVFGLN